MENEYTTKEMKPTETKVKEVKPSKDGEIYQERGLYHFKWAGEVYTYMTKEKAKAGLLIVNG
jgi:phage-related protein